MCDVTSRQVRSALLLSSGDNARRLVGMLLPGGAVDDLLQELHHQQAAAEAQHAQQAHQMYPPQLGSYQGLHLQGHFSQPGTHLLPGGEGVQQLNDLQAVVHNGFGNTGRHS